MPKNYVVTSKGFLKSKTFNSETMKHVFEYTDKLREAQTFHTKGAVTFLQRNKLDGFVYKPYEQEPVRDMYQVRKAQRYNFSDTNLIEKWVVTKAIAKHDSDVSFLSKQTLERDGLYTFEEATKNALRLNTELLTQLTEEIKKLKE